METSFKAARIAGTARRRVGLIAALVAAAGLLSACGSDLSPRPNSEPEASSVGRGRNAVGAESIFGEGGLSIGTINKNSDVFGGGKDEGGQLPVNKYLWQAALDTLSFLPLASSDPFTGVIATDWATNLRTPDERLKVTAFITSAALSAASLKVAVYREVKNEDGAWVAAPVSPDTARKLEDAILSRAREIRIAEREGEIAG